MTPLEEYKNKRDFSKTSEPEQNKKSSKQKKSSEDDPLIFVIQRHDARSLHYDFRLEMEGVLKSWAVPKGPSLNPSDKRLAIMVEDHPYDYHSFEGTIPKGNYGAGEVTIWDKGVYEPLNKVEGKDNETILLEGLKKGSLKILMYGEKLKGEFALVKMNTAKEENAWLLIKHKDKYSVEKNYNAEDHLLKDESKDNPIVSSKKNIKLNEYIKPMLATTGKEPFNDDKWIFEVKWDGYRAIADLSNKENLKLYSRNGISFMNRYPNIQKDLLKQEHSMIIDGEIVALNEKGAPNFQLLQHFAENPNTPVIFQVFDLLYLKGHSTRKLSLLERKELLKDALIETPHIKYCDHIDGNGIDFYSEIQKSNIEGVMAKKKSSIYIDGNRSENWLKIKNNLTEESVIMGYTEPKGSRSYFGSLILGRFINGELQYSGHVGTGFSEESLKQIYELIQPYETNKMPFKEKPKTNMPPTWIEPHIVATIKYTQLTKEGRFRHPVFIGIREDISIDDLKSKDKTAIKGNAEKSNSKKKEIKDVQTEETKNAKSEEIDLNFTNIDKLYWEKEKISKGELIEYYLSISEYILPHLKDRAQSLHRFPNGINKPGFYHKDAGKDAPSWVETISLFSESSNRDINYIVCNNVKTLGYLINLGCIELNPGSNRIEKPNKPDYLIIDLDPSDKNSFKQVVEAAKTTKEILDMADIPGYCKTSGSSGIHIFVPMGANYEYEQVRDFAHLLMQLVQVRLPKTTTLERSLSKRGPKIYLDYLQNREGQTVASVYSARPKPGATVSMPLEWDELTNDLSIKDSTIKNSLIRIEKKGDLFMPVLKSGINIEKALEKLDISQ